MAAEQLLELYGIVGRALLGFGIAIVKRQRIVDERDAGHFDIEKRQFLGGKRREPRIERAGADRVGKNQDSRAGH